MKYIKLDSDHPALVIGAIYTGMGLSCLASAIYSYTFIFNI